MVIPSWFLWPSKQQQDEDEERDRTETDDDRDEEPTTTTTTISTTPSRSTSSSTSIVGGIPVVPGATWYGGHLHLLLNDSFEQVLYTFSEKYANRRGRSTFWMGPTTPSLSVTHWQDVQTLLKGSSYRHAFPLMTIHLQQFFGPTNLLTLNGKEWKHQRKILVRALHGQAFVENNKRAIQQATDVLVQRLGEEIRNNDNRGNGNGNGNGTSDGDSQSDSYYECQDVSKMLRLVTLEHNSQSSFLVITKFICKLELESSLVKVRSFTDSE